MSEDEWLSATDPMPMVELLRNWVGTRKLRLVGCACARRAVSALRDPRLEALVDAGERAADGTDVAAEVEPALDALREAADGWSQHETLVFGGIEHAAVRHSSANLFSTALLWLAAARGWEALDGQDPELDDMDIPVDPAWHEAQEAEYASQASLLRDVFGNPFRPVAFNPYGNQFRPVAFDPSYRTEAAVALARGMYDSRDFSAAPVLADALEDAGCTDAAVLDHLRGGGPHIRGCHVVDAVLGLA